jgi:hypothetical protein
LGVADGLNPNAPTEFEFEFAALLSSSWKMKFLRALIFSAFSQFHPLFIGPSAFFEAGLVENQYWILPDEKNQADVDKKWRKVGKNQFFKVSRSTTYCDVTTQLWRLRKIVPAV